MSYLLNTLFFPSHRIADENENKNKWNFSAVKFALFPAIFDVTGQLDFWYVFNHTKECNDDVLHQEWLLFIPFGIRHFCIFF